MADETRNKIYVSNEITQLEKTSIIKLIEMFTDSKYVNLVPPTPYSECILNSLL